MKLTADSTIADVAAVVSERLSEAGFKAVLTGGACATIYSKGAYQSYDLDFVIQSGGNRKALDAAMSAAGFSRQADRYVHPAVAFFVEFPPGPLSIGDDHNITPTTLRAGRGRTVALSPTDSCRDRLAAFYYWSDRQSLASAVAVARHARVNMSVIRRWSEREGQLDKFQEFQAAVRANARRS